MRKTAAIFFILAFHPMFTALHAEPPSGAAAVQSAAAEDAAKLDVFSALLENFGDLSEDPEWTPDINPKKNPPDIFAAVSFFAREIARPAPAPVLELMAFHIFCEIGENGRLLRTWAKDDYAGKFNGIKWTPALEKARPVFEWCLFGKIPPAESPAWLHAAVSYADFNIADEKGLSLKIDQLSGNPAVLAEFTVEFAARCPDKLPLLLGELARKDVHFSPECAELAFRRWKTQASACLVGTRATTLGSEYDTRMSMAKKNVLAHPFWSNSQRQLLSHLNAKFKSKQSIDTDKFIELAVKTAGNMPDIAADMASASMMWRSCRDPGADIHAVELFWKSLSPGLPDAARKRLAENFALIYLQYYLLYAPSRHNASRFNSFIYLAGSPDSPETLISTAILCGSLKELKTPKDVSATSKPSPSEKSLVSYLVWLESSAAPFN